MLAITERAPRLLTRRGEQLLAPLSIAFDESDLVDFLQCGQPCPDLVQSRLAQEPHALFPSRPADLRSRLLYQNHFADPVAQLEKFMDGGSTAESRSRAFNAT